MSSQVHVYIVDGEVKKKISLLVEQCIFSGAMNIKIYFSFLDQSTFCLLIRNTLVMSTITYVFLEK